MRSATKVHRTARIALRTTPAQRRRCFGLLRAAGDVWAWILDLNRGLEGARLPLVVTFDALCRAMTGHIFGDLARICAEDVLKRYSAAYFQALRRERAGRRAGYPRRKRRLVAVRWRSGSFELSGRRVRLGVARGAPVLVVRLARPVPYAAESVRSVTLLCEAGRLYLDVTAQVEVATHDHVPDRVAGVDLGIIHPYAVACGDQALVVSGRAIRAEERLHLADTKARGRRMGRRAPAKGERGSRRWRRQRGSQARAEARHLRRVRQAQHEAAHQVVSWAVDHKVARLVVGDPRGITRRDAGRHQNRRLRTWRRAHLLGCLRDKAELAGIAVVLVNERGTSSTCPECHAGVPKPRGRRFACPHCGHTGHRDVVGARNIAALGGGSTHAPACVTHRRAGHPPARRDRRRQRFDDRRSCPAPGRPERSGRRSQAGCPGAGQPAAGTLRAPEASACEDR